MRMADNIVRNGVLTMKQSLVQLVVGLIGLTVLVWGETKHYVESHPEILSTWQLTQTQRMQPIQYYVYQIAYDPNTDKTWYLYNDGFWYDKPPKIRKYQNQSQKVLGNPEGSQQPHVRVGTNGQSPQTSTHTSRY